MTSRTNLVDSGVPWLGRVPTGWKTKPLWSMFERIKDVNHPEEQMLSVFREFGVIVKDSRENLNKTAENRSIYQLVHPGWLVANRMKAWQGSVGISSLRGIISGHYICFAPRHGEDNRYLNWLLRSTVYTNGYGLLSRGVRIGQAEIDNDHFRLMPILLPPLQEQLAIANYLDRETARIDTLIEEQQRLIELLHERRDSAIRAVLLRGLDYDAPLHASGSEFLGSIPSAWSIVPTRHLCTITTGDEDSGNASDDGAYPFYVRGREILRSDSYAFDGEAVMTPGDGQGGTGKVFHYFDGKFQAHQRVYVFTDFRGIIGRYFYYYLSTFLRPIALAGSNTVTMESLRRPLLASFPVAVPPTDEQVRVVEHLDEEAAKINQLIAETERVIELARERRTALITAAVTGQIDVQELV